MPKISAFYGIVIYMYYEDHNPPHFHAKYNEFEALIGIDNFGIIKGNLPPKALALVIEWTSLHKEELLLNWENSINGTELSLIEPLK